MKKKLLEASIDHTKSTINDKWSLTLFRVGGLKYPQRPKCLKNSAKTKKIKKNTKKTSGASQGGSVMAFLGIFLGANVRI